MSPPDAQSNGSLKEGSIEPEGDKEREVRYAKPYDYFSVNIRYKVALLIMGLQISIISFFLVAITFLERTIQWVAISLYFFCLMFLGWNYIRLSMREAMSCQGWVDYAKAFKSFSSGFVIISIIPVVIVIVNNITKNIIEIGPIILLILLLTFIKIIFSSFENKLVSTKGFRFSIGDAKFLLMKYKEKLLLTSSVLEKNQFNKLSISIKNEKISIQKSSIFVPRSCTIFITTPHDQPDRHRELREAVSAILEGRPWLPKPGDGNILTAETLRKVKVE